MLETKNILSLRNRNGGPKLNTEVLVLFDKWNQILEAHEGFFSIITEETFSVCLEKNTIESSAKLEVSIVLADDDFIKGLNMEYRNIDAPTNVLAFPHFNVLESNFLVSVRESLLGDIILSYETILKEAYKMQKPFVHHATHMIIHGMLHLMGFDHENNANASEMEGLECLVLKSLLNSNFLTNIKVS